MIRLAALITFIVLSFNANAASTGDSGLSVPELKLATIRLAHAQCLVDTDTGETLYTFTTEEGVRAYRQNVVDNDVLKHWPRLQYHKYKMIVCD